LLSLTISSLFGSFLEIYRENGILGYYAGLIPRVIGSAAVIVLTGISTYAINNYVIQEPAMKPYTASTMKVSANPILIQYRSKVSVYLGFYTIR
jgi:mitochondrial carrier